MKLSTKCLTHAMLLGVMASFPVISMAEAPVKLGVFQPSKEAQHLFMQGRALITRNQISQGILILDKAAAQGHPQASYELASLYEAGLGVQQNFQRARHYYEVAIEQGHRDAHFNLALLYNDGGAPFGNLQRARELMQVVAQQGDIEAQFLLGTMMNSTAANAAKNPTQAIHWLSRAANRGHEKAQFQLGMTYLKGTDVARDSKKALHWFTKAAQKNVAGAHFNLAVMNERGDGMPANMDAAIRWYTTAAGLGNVNAQQNLGIKYLMGEQVAANPTKALQLISRAATSGLKNSQLLLGQLYQTGFEGKVQIDLNKAEKWYLRAAKQGQPDAQYHLAVILLEKQSQGDAKFWIQQAASAGHQEAMKLQASL